MTHKQRCVVSFRKTKCCSKLFILKDMAYISYVNYMLANLLLPEQLILYMHIVSITILWKRNCVVF
jgi:hypothetical protein